MGVSDTYLKTAEKHGKGATQKAEMFADFPDVINIKQLQEMLGVGRSTAYALIAEGKIAHKRVGKQIKIAKVSVTAYIMEWPSKTNAEE